MKALLKTVCASVVLAALAGTAGLAQTNEGPASRRAQADTPPAPAQTSKRQASDQPGYGWAGYGSGHDSPYRAFNAVDPQGVPASAGAAHSRETALKDCTAQSRKYSQTTWGNMELHQERTCMTARGQME